MRIDLIGGGAVGLLYGSRLALGGAQVRMLTRGREQAGLLAREGIRLTGRADAAEGAPAAVAEVEALSLADAAAAEAAAGGRAGRWHVLAVKQTAIGPELLELLAALLRPGDGLLCLQNGIGHLERLAKALPEVRLYAGVTSEGALRAGAREVVHTGEGELHYGPAPGSAAAGLAEDALLGGWRQALRQAGIAAFLSNDVEDRICRKLLLNAVINPLTALLDLPNGRLPEHPQGGRLMKALHAESLAILVRSGFAATGEEWERLLDVCRRTAANTSSMLADVRAGRPTEIDSINGELARLAARHGMPAPLNEAAAALVHALE
ncbi:2-dehydropantoate 2-reductase [Paenibacillus albicereus]|uniref:2-dehydropantoate 2-reductase n=1 Tax=Paenibacillus albicereus TaxID=2726185 RepID=A0A6H2GYQ4_9BACL|nr:2-dehydropantoate 2-reductase [Paenibacillus albicereus]QJC52517.1 2-dehydropantoate 2-reductase [Paenibacillus albicereus]